MLKLIDTVLKEIVLPLRNVAHRLDRIAYVLGHRLCGHEVAANVHGTQCCLTCRTHIDLTTPELSLGDT